MLLGSILPAGHKASWRGCHYSWARQTFSNIIYYFTYICGIRVFKKKISIEKQKKSYKVRPTRSPFELCNSVNEAVWKRRCWRGTFPRFEALSTRPRHVPYLRAVSGPAGQPLIYCYSLTLVTPFTLIHLFRECVRSRGYRKRSKIFHNLKPIPLFVLNKVARVLTRT